MKKRIILADPFLSSKLIGAVKLQLIRQAGDNLFTGYGSGYVAVNGQRYHRSLVVMPQQVIEDRLAANFEQLTAGHFEFLLEFDPQIVLLGTGAALRFPPPGLTRCLTAARIGLEVMDTSAACRTYNVLTAEGRNVVAAILIA